MKKSQFISFATAVENREKLSIEYRNKYKEGNEKAIFDFIKLDRTNIKEEWVKEAVMGWVMNRDADRTLKLARVFQKPCYTDLDSNIPEGKEMLRTVKLLYLVRQLRRESGWSEDKVLEALEDLYTTREYEGEQEGADPSTVKDTVIECAQEHYPELPEKLVEEFLAMDLSSIKGAKKRISQDYLIDILTKRFKKYERIFPYLQK
jgi:hypothetical protein